MFKANKTKIIIFIIFIKIVYTDSWIKINPHETTMKYNIWYLDRLIFVESSNNPRATSDKNAKGLMQIMDVVVQDHNTFCDCGKQYTHNQMYDIKNNLHVGIWQLKRLDKYHDGCEIKTVSSYNMGQRHTDENIYNIDYLFRILGTNRTLVWLKGKKTKSWKGSYRAYHVY